MVLTVDRRAEVLLQLESQLIQNLPLATHYGRGKIRTLLNHYFLCPMELSTHKNDHLSLCHMCQAQPKTVPSLPKEIQRTRAIPFEDIQIGSIELQDVAHTGTF